LRALYAFVAQGMRQQMAYKVEGWIGIGSTVIWLTLYVGIWGALLKGDPVALQAQLAYVIAMRALSELNMVPTWELNDKFRQGDVALELIKPVSLPVRLVSGYFGASLIRVLRALPVFVLGWLFLGLAAPAPDRVGLFLISALFSHLIASTGPIALAMIALWTVQFDEADNLWSIAVVLFSGQLVPLHYLPDWVARFAQWLPFSGIFYTPSAILSGTLQGGALWQALAIQAGWAVALSAVLGLVWRAGGRRLTVQGG
jgi:ABC-2 type transport system permease protein